MGKDNDTRPDYTPSPPTTETESDSSSDSKSTNKRTKKPTATITKKPRRNSHSSSMESVRLRPRSDSSRDRDSSRARSCDSRKTRHRHHSSSSSRDDTDDSSAARATKRSRKEKHKKPRRSMSRDSIKRRSDSHRSSDSHERNNNSGARERFWNAGRGGNFDNNGRDRSCSQQPVRIAPNYYDTPQESRSAVIATWQNMMIAKIARDKQKNDAEFQRLHREQRQFEEEKAAFEQDKIEMEEDVQKKLERVAKEGKKYQHILNQCQWMDTQLKEREATLLQDCTKYEQRLLTVNVRSKMNNEEDERLKAKHLILVQEELRFQKEKKILLEFVTKCSAMCKVNETEEIQTNFDSFRTGHLVEVQIPPIPVELVQIFQESENSTFTSKGTNSTICETNLIDTSLAHGSVSVAGDETENSVCKEISDDISVEMSMSMVLSDEIHVGGVFEQIDDSVSSSTSQGNGDKSNVEAFESGEELDLNLVSDSIPTITPPLVDNCDLNGGEIFKEASTSGEFKSNEEQLEDIIQAFISNPDGSQISNDTPVPSPSESAPPQTEPEPLASLSISEGELNSGQQFDEIVLVPNLNEDDGQVELPPEIPPDENNCECESAQSQTEELASLSISEGELNSEQLDEIGPEPISEQETDQVELPPEIPPVVSLSETIEILEETPAAIFPDTIDDSEKVPQEECPVDNQTEKLSPEPPTLNPSDSISELHEIPRPLPSPENHIEMSPVAMEDQSSEIMDILLDSSSSSSPPPENTEEYVPMTVSISSPENEIQLVYTPTRAHSSPNQQTEPEYVPQKLSPIQENDSGAQIETSPDSDSEIEEIAYVPTKMSADPPGDDNEQLVYVPAECHFESTELQIAPLQPSPSFDDSTEDSEPEMSPGDISGHSPRKQSGLCDTPYKSMSPETIVSDIVERDEAGEISPAVNPVSPGEIIETDISEISPPPFPTENEEEYQNSNQGTRTAPPTRMSANEEQLKIMETALRQRNLSSQNYQPEFEFGRQNIDRTSSVNEMSEMSESLQAQRRRLTQTMTRPRHDYGHNEGHHQEQSNYNDQRYDQNEFGSYQRQNNSWSSYQEDDDVTGFGFARDAPMRVTQMREPQRQSWDYYRGQNDYRHPPHGSRYNHWTSSRRGTRSIKRSRDLDGEWY